jgi:hypothetical protein
MPLYESLGSNNWKQAILVPESNLFSEIESRETPPARNPGRAKKKTVEGKRIRKGGWCQDLTPILNIRISPPRISTCPGKLHGYPLPIFSQLHWCFP